MVKKNYLQPEIRVLVLQHESVLAASGGSPIYCAQFGGNEPGDDTAGESEPLF